MLATRGRRRIDQREPALDRAAGGIEDDVERVTSVLISAPPN